MFGRYSAHIVTSIYLVVTLTYIRQGLPYYFSASMVVMGNEAGRQTWATRADGWVRDTRVLDLAFAPFTAAILNAAGLDSAHRVLDIGCGMGTLLEEVTAAGVEAVGFDIAPVMVDAARARVPAATAIQADAQTADLPAMAGGVRFDTVLSRFGVMFFDDPVAAFANIRAATGPGARLVLASWRADERDMFR
ncbi:MAG: class I SAM-dependent methyltransferase, partial [Nocardioides sp.]|nr:class I SAM-dependent methyltransferase [Nocardioides sp.]